MQRWSRTYKDLIKNLTPKFNDVFILENVFGIGDEDKELVSESWNAMMDLLVLAFDEKYTKEEIENFLDFNSVPYVFEVFYGLSSLKKKQKMMEQQKQKKLNGINYMPVLYKTHL